MTLAVTPNTDERCDSHHCLLAMLFSRRRRHRRLAPTRDAGAHHIQAGRHHLSLPTWSGSEITRSTPTHIYAGSWTFLRLHRHSVTCSMFFRRTLAFFFATGTPLVSGMQPMGRRTTGSLTTFWSQLKTYDILFKFISGTVSLLVSI